MQPLPNCALKPSAGSGNMCLLLWVLSATPQLAYKHPTVLHLIMYKPSSSYPNSLNASSLLCWPSNRTLSRTESILLHQNSLRCIRHVWNLCHLSLSWKLPKMVIAQWLECYFDRSSVWNRMNSVTGCRKCFSVIVIPPDSMAAQIQ